MTDINKATQILESTNKGKDLPKHHQMIVSAAFMDELGESGAIFGVKMGGYFYMNITKDIIASKQHF